MHAPPEKVVYSKMYSKVIAHSCTNLTRLLPDNIYELKIINMLEKLDQLADELYAEFGFVTCSTDQQEIILKEFIKRGYYLVSIES